jgi:pyruvate dehydrogenase E1 component beta subunit
MTVMTYREALRSAMADEMERDDSVVVLGEDIGVYGGTHLVTDTLLERFGPKRVIDTPIAEGGFTGAAIGMAMMGMRPIVEMMTWNFSFQAADQIIQNAAKLHYFSGGQVNVPLVIRGPNGGGVQLSAQHTHSLEGFYGHFPGLKVVSPVTPEDAKGMMLTSIRDPDPVIFLESGALYGTKGEVPDGDYTVEFGKARIAKSGTDITLIDVETIVDSVKKTNRAVVVQEQWRWFSVASEVAALIQEQAFDYMDAPVERVSGAEAPAPYSRSLEAAAFPSEQDVIDAARRALYRKA